MKNIEKFLENADKLIKWNSKYNWRRNLSIWLSYKKN